ncbi:MAG: bifunctional oligoribonuclease/PAP phosphatase NrnA [Selenomonadaceae bacterium]|nr:bifunctional oligoribonuclease/PAP phosphatase NrnA [Selenomonadaceae bacterium]
MQIELREAAAKLKSAQKIIVTAHINPDGDAIGSSLALVQILKLMHKDVRIFIDDVLPPNFMILPFVDNIERPNDNDKLTADLLVILDTQTDRIGRVFNMVEAPILNIDHHVTNTGANVDYLYLDPNAAATCEIIFNLSKYLDVELTMNIARCLYTGLATDTGFFNYANTKSSTMRAAAALIDAGVKPNEIAEQMERKSLADFKGLVETLKTMQLFYDGKVVGIFANEEIAKSVDSTEGFIDLIRVIDGVDVAFLLTCKSENFCRVSMRSKTVDVSKIARKLGGGGHIRAAGCSIKTSFEEAKQIIVDAIGEAIN